MITLTLTEQQARELSRMMEVEAISADQAAARSILPSNRESWHHRALVALELKSKTDRAISETEVH